MEKKYTPPQKRVITSVALEEDVRNWLDQNIPNRSHFFNALAREYIMREREMIRRAKVQAPK